MNETDFSLEDFDLPEWATVTDDRKVSVPTLEHSKQILDYVPQKYDHLWSVWIEDETDRKTALRLIEEKRKFWKSQ